MVTGHGNQMSQTMSCKHLLSTPIHVTRPKLPQNIPSLRTKVKLTLKVKFPLYLKVASISRVYKVEVNFFSKVHSK